MTELRLYCKQCGAFHSTHGEACNSQILAPERGETNVVERLLQNRYQVFGLLDGKNSSNIFWGKDTHAENDIVAIKAIQFPKSITSMPQCDPTTSELSTSFLRLLDRLQTLRHPGLPRIRTAFVEAAIAEQSEDTNCQHCFLVMDYIDGCTLEEYIAPSMEGLAQSGTHKLPPGEVFNIGLQLCSLLAYLHHQQPACILGHLHPSTLIRSNGGQISLTNLYATHTLQAQLYNDTATIPHGIRRYSRMYRAYSAPEIAATPAEQRTPAADIYGLGVLLHQLCTGYDPNETPGMFAPLHTLHNPALSALDHLLQRMLHKNPAQRPRAIEAIEASLHQIQRDYAIVHADIPEVLSPYEAAIEAHPLVVVKDPALSLSDRFLPSSAGSEYPEIHETTT